MKLRLLLPIVAALSIVAGSYVVDRAPAARTPVAVPQALEDPAPAHGQMTTDELLAFWRGRYEREPRDYISLTYLGQTFLRKARETGDVGDYARAEAALRQALAINPNYDTALAHLGAVHYARHEFREAIALATRAYEANPRLVQALATIGDAQLELGDYAAAATIYDTLAARAPGPAVGSRLARLAWLRGRPEEAVLLLRQAAADAATLGLRGEDTAWYRYQLGELYFGMGRLDEADRQFAAADRLFPNYYLALAGQGKVHAAQGRLDEAIARYERAVAIVPQPDLLAALGDLYAVAGRPDDAARQYETVEFIGRLAAIDQALYNRQLALFWANHDRQVDKALELALAEYAVRQDIYGRDALAWALYKNGNLREAAARIDEALAFGTRDVLLYYHAGMIYAGLGEPERARGFLREALAINPHFDPVQAPRARAELARLDAR